MLSRRARTRSNVGRPGYATGNHSRPDTCSDSAANRSIRAPIRDHGRAWDVGNHGTPCKRDDVAPASAQRQSDGGGDPQNAIQKNTACYGLL